MWKVRLLTNLPIDGATVLHAGDEILLKPLEAALLVLYQVAELVAIE